MTRVYIADPKPEESSAIRLLLQDLNIEVAGEAPDWVTTLVQVPISRVDILLADWELIPNNNPNAALDEIRKACPNLLIIALIKHQGVLKKIEHSDNIDAFISKNESPERVAEHLRAVEASIYSNALLD